ncbi:MAG: (2Fe-2S) ferredoxin domain-containing protein [Deltaproteobacteria bacterium]|nr:(2Fe-2S) ferredoxin domain-containing protein [Deltaproteobacteria bacterium]MBN2673502.1 (2Fe-2S) ferredoxin domain-containing protein [Deltaproteobacteria bacterium]
MEKTPFKVHAFVCTNDRHGSSKSCADGDSQRIKDELKRALKQAHLWGTLARVSTSGCLGNCAHGPNVYIYPQMQMFTGCTVDDVPEILAAIERNLE